MSVVKSKRGETTLTVLTKARELSIYTIRICSNEKNFPKHYRWCITAKIVDATIDINNNVNMANAVYVKEAADRELRKAYQVRALAATYALLSMIDIAFCAFGIDSERVKYWTGLIVEVQNLIRNWRKSDTERYKTIG